MSEAQKYSSVQVRVKPNRALKVLTRQYSTSLKIKCICFIVFINGSSVLMLYCDFYVKPLCAADLVLNLCDISLIEIKDELNQSDTFEMLPLCIV